MVLRAANVAQAFENIVTAKVSTSAADARRLGYLSEADGVTMNRLRLLGEAKASVKRDYSAPVPRMDIPAPELPPLKVQLTGHDVTVAKHVATILSGGVAPGTLLSEQHFLDLEREAFLSLCGDKKTEERIAHTLRTGKPLKN